MKSLQTLRDAIDQRQHELIKQLLPWHTDYLLNAMQQVYYSAKNEAGPHCPVYTMYTDEGRAMMDAWLEME